MSCTRQLDARELIDKPADVTRSTVQKSVVIVAKSPHVFTAWREKLSLVTRAWFMQKEFTDRTILKEFQENLEEGERNTTDEERDHFVGLSLREFVHDFKHQALLLFKCCLLQPKMLFFGSRCERLCMMQFALISLIPGLIRSLEDCADPELEEYGKRAEKPTGINTNDRKSLLSFVGLPLQIFGKGSLFGPYTPLQQLDVLADYDTKSYIVGSTNSLLLQQKDRYSDIIINLDDLSINITSSSLRNALNLTAADRRWIDLIYQDVVATWDPANPTRPSDLGFKGSEDYIRIHFEQYIIAFLSANSLHQYLMSLPPHRRLTSPLPDVEGDPALDFGEPYLEAWQTTTSFGLWSRLTADQHIFDFVDPRHPTAGGFSIDDFNRRFAQQFHDLQLDERFASSREAVGKTLASGQKRFWAAVGNIQAEVEARRVARARAAGETASSVQLPQSAPPGVIGSGGTGAHSPAGSFFDATTIRARAPDLSGASAAASAAGQKAGAYFSSWGSWAVERRKGWGAKAVASDNTSLARPQSVPVQASIGRPSSSHGQGEELREKSGSDLNGGEKRVEEKRKSTGSVASVHGPRSPRKGIIRRGVSREEIGADGIGRLDA
jgi:hypothetical protein